MICCRSQERAASQRWWQGAWLWKGGLEYVGLVRLGLERDLLQSEPLRRTAGRLLILPKRMEGLAKGNPELCVCLMSRTQIPRTWQCRCDSSTAVLCCEPVWRREHIVPALSHFTDIDESLKRGGLCRSVVFVLGILRAIVPVVGVIAGGCSMLSGALLSLSRKVTQPMVQNIACCTSEACKNTFSVSWQGHSWFWRNIRWRTSRHVAVTCLFRFVRYSLYNAMWVLRRRTHVTNSYQRCRTDDKLLGAGELKS